MTSVSTSLALTLWSRGRQILIAMAVRECLMRQYWKKQKQLRLNGKSQPLRQLKKVTPLRKGLIPIGKNKK